MEKHQVPLLPRSGLCAALTAWQTPGTSHTSIANAGYPVKKHLFLESPCSPHFKQRSLEGKLIETDGFFFVDPEERVPLGLNATIPDHGRTAEPGQQPVTAVERRGRKSAGTACTDCV